MIEKRPELQTVYLSSVAKNALKEEDTTIFAEALLGSVMMLNELKLSDQELVTKNIQPDDLKNVELNRITFLKDSFFVTCVVLLGKNKLSQQVIDSWKGALNKNQCFDLDNWFKALGGILISKDVEAEDVMQYIFVDIKQDAMLRYVAALSIINDNATNSPVNLIECQAFILARYRAFKSDPGFITSFGKMVVISWLRFIKNYPKSLVKLDENISGIQDLLQEEINDFDDIAKVIRAVRVVVNMHKNSFTDAMLESFNNYQNIDSSIPPKNN
jgi:hypothetical protein